MEGQEISDQSKISSKNNSLIKSLNILVVDDDTTCLSIVAAILKSWEYQVVTVKHPNDALSALKINGSSFDLVITDVHMPDMDGFELQKQIDRDFQLPVVFMSADDQDGIMIKGLQGGASFFITKPVSPNDLRHLWQYALANKRGNLIIEELETTQHASKPEKPWDENTLIPKSISPITNEESNTKMKLLVRKEIKDVFVMPPKKAKFVWTSSLHNQFLEAIKILGLEKAVPKKILEIMNVPGLTREHVASHLQKYRIFVRKVTETSSRVHNHHHQPASAPELSSNSISKKYSLGGHFPISKSPKLGLSSSFNHRQRFTDDISSLLYNGRNSKKSMFEIPKSSNKTSDFVSGNKPNVLFYGDFSKGFGIGEQKPQMGQYGINSGINIKKIESFNNQNFNFDPNFRRLAKLGAFDNKGLDGSSNFVSENKLMNGTVDNSMSNNGVNIDMPSFEKIGPFNNQNFNFDPNFRRLAKLGTFENKGLDGLSNFVSEDRLMNGIRNNSMSNNGVNTDTPNFEKIGSFNNQIFNFEPNFRGLAKLGTFDNKGLDGSSNFVSENKLMNGIGNNRMINNGVAIDTRSFEKIGPFNNQNFNFDPNFRGLAKLGSFENKGLDGSSNFVSENTLTNGIRNNSMSPIPDFGDTLVELGASSVNNENQSIFESTPQIPKSDNNGVDNFAIFGRLDDFSDFGSNCFPQQFGDQGNVSFTWLNQTNTQSQNQIQQSAGGEELTPDFGVAASPSVDQFLQSFDQNSFEIDDEEFFQSLFNPAKDDGDRQNGTF